MRNTRPIVLLLLSLAVLLSACVGDLVRRVSPPAAGIQQLTVGADGRWQLQVRLNNFSNVPMRFTALHLQLDVQGIAAGTLDAAPNLDIGPTSADVASVVLTPSVDARIAIANALASGQGVAYRLQGTVTAAADGKRNHEYPLHAESRLNPAPGLAGVLR